MSKCSHLRIALTVRVRGLRAHLAIVLWYYSIVVIKEFEITDIPTSSWEDGMQNWLKNVSMNIDSGLSEIAITKIEKMLIKTALERSNGKKNDAAQILGWGRNTLSKKMKEHGI